MKNVDKGDKRELQLLVLSAPSLSQDKETLSLSLLTPRHQLRSPEILPRQ